MIKLIEDVKEWNEFLSSREHYVFHTPEYKDLIEKTFPSAKGLYYGNYISGKLVGLFPLFIIRQEGINRLLKGFELFKDKIISAAFNDYGGWVGDVDVNEVMKLASSVAKVNNVEVRGGSVKSDLPSLKYKRFIVKLDNKEEVWARIQKDKRKAIKKSERDGVIVRDLTLKDLDNMYLLYLRNMRSFGVPPFSKKYFENYFRTIVGSGLGKVIGAFVDDRLASWLLGHTCGDRVHITIAVSNPKDLGLRVNDAVHWKFIEWSLDNGYRYFDFGRTREDSGQFKYKQKWGGMIEDLPYYFAVNSGEIPHVDPKNKKYSFVMKIYGKLPLWVHEKVGSKLREGLGI